MTKLLRAHAIAKRLCGLFLVLWGLIFAQPSQAQFLDCSCLATQAVLFTNGCVGVIPDLCTVVSNCWFPNASSTGFTCTQNPPAGTVVTAATPISFTLFDQPSNTPYTCNPVFYVGASSNRFTLICASNLVVDCSSTNWSFPAPTWTNAMCCTNVILSGPSIVTNWPVLTASWIGFACGVVDFCSQSITFANSNGLSCDCLDIFCSTNIIVPTCLGTTAGSLTNIFWPLPIVSNYCIGTITNIFCVPPSGSPFPVGTNPVTCVVLDDLGNVETCTFDVIVLPDLDPPNVACANLTIPCGSPWTPTPPPAFDVCCGAAGVTAMLQSIFTNVVSQCETKIFLDWHVTDCNFNATNCTEVITIVDLTPPVIQCNSNRTVQCGVTAAGTPGPWVPTPPTAFDACCPTPPIVSLVSSNSTGPQCNQFMTLVWMAEDCCTNIAYCTEVVNIVDATPPIINCQPFKQIGCGTNIIGDLPTAFDQCCGTNVTVSVLSIITNVTGTCFSSYVIIWQAVDCCTNIATCPQQVNVVDNTPPNVICAPDTNINCGQPLIFTPPTAFDDCCGALVTISPLGLLTNAAASCPYSVMARWLIADCCGNVTNCDQTIHILDTVPPVINCPPNQTVPCGSAWTLGTATATDACCSNVSVQVVSLTTNSAPPCAETVTAVWMARDCCNNLAFCTNTISVVDTTPPVIQCNSNQFFKCTLPGTPGGWQPVPPQAFDLCCGPIAPVVSLVSSLTNGNQCLQTITLTWSATDCCSNTAYCTETVTIVDNTPPILNCQPFRQLECGSNFLGDLPTAFDQCCGTNVTVSVANIITNVTGTCFSSYLVIWQAVDCCTNITTCPQQINVLDTIAPNVLCPPDTNIVCGQPLIFTPPTAFDDCCGGLVTITLQNLITNAAGVCPYTVTAHWLITDCCGNATNCNQTIDIVDTVPPVLVCAPNQTVPCGSSWSLIPPTATDACCPASGVNVVLQSLSTNSAPPCLQVVTAIWQAVDCCQNISFCTNTVTVVDVTPPIIQCSSNKVFACGPGSTGVGWQPTPPQAFDVCCGPIAPLVSLVSSLTNGNLCGQVITLTWSATDCCSNIAYCTETVSIIDTNPPIMTCAPLKFVECGTAWTFDLPTAFDLCCGTNVTINIASNLTIVSTPCFSIYERYWTATDCCTNVAVCSQRVIAQDTLPPMVNCPSNGVIQCGQPLVFTPPTATDLCCPVASITITPLPLSTNSLVNCPIEIRQTWIITDCCGNATNCTQIIHVVDTVPPVITCPPNQTLPCGSTWALGTPSATDACCANVAITLTSLTTNSSPPCLEVITATWTATDCCSNSVTCTQTITIVDLTPPVIQCKSNQVFACGPNAAGGGWQPTPPQAFDVCCGPIAPLVSLVSSLTNGNLCGQVITLTWSATDCCSNIAYCTETVSIIDTNPPILTCAPLKFVECGTGWTFDPPIGAFDLCCGTNVTINVASNLVIVSTPCFSIYEQFWTATDCCSNVAVCSQRVIEQDTLPPMVICPPTQVIECGQPVVFGQPIANDLCCPPTGILILAQTTVTNIMSPCFKVLSTTWVIADCCGNTTTCTQFIEIMDTTPPVIVCGPNQTIQCGLPFSPAPPLSVTDACCGLIVSMGVTTFTTNSIGPCADIIEAIWTAFDCCGNTATCTNYVSIVDTLPPVINCPPGPRIVQCGQPLVPPVVFDQCCTNVTMSLANATTNTLGNCTNQVILSWQASDCCGNSTTCVETNLIVDLVPPSIACLPPVWVQCGTPIVFTPPSAFDACCGTNITIINAGTTVFGSSPCFRIHLRNWQAVDCCGNATNCSQFIVEQDNTPPVITGVSNQVVQCQLFPFTWPVPSAVDACCGSNVTLSVISNTVSATSCPRIYTRVYRATDCCGNVSYITQTVTEVDTIPPIIGCQSNFTIAAGSPWSFGTPLAGDSCCPGGVFAVSTITNIVNPCIKNVTRTWIAYDCCSNSATCSQTVTITSGGPPNDLCQNAFPLFINMPPICGSNICATPSLPGSLVITPCGASANAPDVWYVMTPQCSGMVRINTCNPCTGFPMFDTVLSAYTGPCPGTLTQVPGGCNDDACGLQSIINIPVIAGQTYYIRVSGWAGATGWFGLQATQLSSSPPPNDYCTNAIPVTIGSPAACGTTECASPSLSNNVPLIPIPCGPSIQANDVWYRFTPTCTGPVIVDTCGVCPGSNTFNTVLSAYTGSCGALSQIACNNNALLPGCITQSRITFMGTAGVTYYIRVSGVGLAAGQFQLNIQQNIIPPPNDLCVNATPITAGTYAWNNCGATATGPSASCATFFHDIWYRFTALCAGPVWVNTCGTTLNTYLAVYTNTCALPAPIACNDNATAGPCAPSSQSFVSFNAVAGMTYFIRVGTPSGVMGPGQLTLVGPTPPPGTCPPPGPCSWKMYRILGNPNCIPWSWSISSPCCMSVGATNAGPVCSGNANALAAAFVASINAVCPSLNATAISLPPPFHGRFLVCSPCGTNMTLSVGAAGVLPMNQCVVANTGGWSPIPVGWCSFNPDIDEVPPSGHDYNGNGMDDAFDIDLGTSDDTDANGIPDEADCLVPDVTIIPEGQLVQLGDELMLSTIATGTTPLSYQWNLNGSPIAGATSDTFMVTSVNTSDIGLYSVTVSNHCGVTTSAGAEVRLSQPVLLDAAFDGQEFQFTVHTKTGFNYVIEYKNNLNSQTWTTLTTLPGNGEPQIVTDPAPAPQMRYYRARATLSP